MPQQKSSPHPDDKTVRLNRYLAQLGVASRRKIDELIGRNQVKVNGRPASLGYKIDPAHDTVTVGRKTFPPQKTQTDFEYWLVYKPVGFISTTSDPEHRPTAVSLVKSSARLFPVGRLDRDSEGLLLLTNDGELTQRLTHPSHHVPKTYRVWINGTLTERALDRIRRGVKLKHVRVAPAEVTVLQEERNTAVLELVLHQGMNRQIRRMMNGLNWEVTRLLRVSVGPLELGSLRPGRSRRLQPLEISQLKKL